MPSYSFRGTSHIPFLALAWPNAPCTYHTVVSVKPALNYMGTGGCRTGLNTTAVGNPTELSFYLLPLIGSWPEIRILAADFTSSLPDISETLLRIGLVNTSITEGTGYLNPTVFILAPNKTRCLPRAKHLCSRENVHERINNDLCKHAGVTNIFLYSYDAFLSYAFCMDSSWNFMISHLWLLHWKNPLRSLTFYVHHQYLLGIYQWHDLTSSMEVPHVLRSDLCSRNVWTPLHCWMVAELDLQLSCCKYTQLTCRELESILFEANHFLSSIYRPWNRVTTDRNPRVPLPSSTLPSSKDQTAQGCRSIECEELGEQPPSRFRPLPSCWQTEWCCQLSFHHAAQVQNYMKD